MPLRLAVRRFEREYILAALERAGGNVARAARELGCGHSTLKGKLTSYRRAERREVERVKGDLDRQLAGVDAMLAAARKAGVLR